MGRFIYRPHCRGFQNSQRGKHRKGPPHASQFHLGALLEVPGPHQEAETAMTESKAPAVIIGNELAFQAFKETHPTVNC